MRTLSSNNKKIYLPFLEGGRKLKGVREIALLFFCAFFKREGTPLWSDFYGILLDISTCAVVGFFVHLNRKIECYDFLKKISCKIRWR
ncbi:MAG TPA: hypothetical protein DD412_06385 [Holosporales bacterium]|nr:hypothetical protein [Holosporales bacterium]